MRVMVFFDLPVETIEDKREYRRFRKLLIRSGFLMMQQSVYCRMVLNQSVVRSVTELLRKHKPRRGIVQILTVTEKQFAGIECVTGSFQSDVIDSDERVIVL